MANSKVLEAINEQINKEFFSSFFYLSMSADLANKGLAGFANWMRIHAQEEIIHAMKMYDFIITRGGKVELQSVAGPQITWKDPLDIAQSALEHEKLVTNHINTLMDLALSEKDHASCIFLQWFVNEQVEEEELFSDLVNKLKLIDNNSVALLMLDKDMEGRTLVDKTTTEA